ncbi:MAG: NADH-quinone oxidoreductase subunit J [Bacteroidia bacterium]|nr:NADH-quinone oxidoreductase subunit J [Bacteroidia bacterium]MDW8300831.1 NADH-quinone oxidoreductase subunit J [Bacteroidia bacterium]
MSVYLFYFLSFLALLSAAMVIISKNPVHSVLYLILTFFCLTGHYILLNAQFVAIVNIIVYAGAIMVLFLFVIMFLNLKENPEKTKAAYLKFAAVISGGILLTLFIAILRKVELMPVDYINFDAEIGLVEKLGKVLYRDYLLPFELASILFLAAMVGAVMLGKREVGERNF